MQKDRNQVEEGFSYMSYAALFDAALDEKKRQRNDKREDPLVGVRLFLIVLGGGEFANQEENVQRGFLRAALEFQDCLEKEGVEVILESGQANDAWTKITTTYNLRRILT